MTFFPSSSIFKVLGYLNRNALDTKNLIKEIKAIASIPTERYFFNVSDEAALLEKAGTLGEQIFSIEGKRTSFKNFFQEFLILLLYSCSVNVNLYTLYEKNSYESVRKIDNMSELFIRYKWLINIRKYSQFQ